MIGAFIKTEQTEQQARNSKILNRKQIEKRLVGLKTEQYEKITKNLKYQNDKLKKQVQLLNDKVQQLMKARKIHKPSNNPVIEQEIGKLKKQLQLKYESMNYLKDIVKRRNQTDQTEDIKIKIKDHQNVLTRIERESKQLENEKEKLKRSIIFLEQNLTEFIPSNEHDQQMESLKIENKFVKQKVNRLNQKLKYQQKQSQSTINKIYTLKSEEKKRNIFSSSNKHISATLNDIKSSSINEINDLQKQIQDLKNRKKYTEREIVSDKIIKQTKKSKMEKTIKQSLDLQKELYNKKLKCSNILNLYEKKEEQIKHFVEKKEKLKNRQFKQKNTQTQFQEKKEYRKDSFGKFEGTLFNDSQLLPKKGQALVKGVTVYKSPQCISYIKCHYEMTSTKKKIQSEPPFEKFILKKCQAKKFESKTLAPLINLIVSVSSNKKFINRIQLKWMDGEASVIGWQTENSTKYYFDISNDQRPVCMFGSVMPHGKHMYALESLGFEIKNIDEQ